MMRSALAVLPASAALLVLLLLPSIAAGQGILGAPLPDSTVEKGGIVVQVVNGTMSRPMSAHEVSLVEETSGKELVVRTGPDGRAQFRGLKIGARYTAFIKVGDVEKSSLPLLVPGDSGLRVLLSPVPLRVDTSGPTGPSGGPAAGPHAGGGVGGMPDPRQMSGQARGEPKDPPGQLTVRLLQGKFRVDPVTGNRVADFPKDATVHLVTFRSDKTASLTSEKVDDGGRVVFRRLKTDYTESYWVFTSFKRNGRIDRLQSTGIELPPQVGLRLMLAGLGPDSVADGVDDLEMVKEGARKLPAVGDVAVELAWEGNRVGLVELVDLKTGNTVSTAKPAAESERGPVMARAGEVELDAAIRDGIVQVRVAGPAGPLAGAGVKVVPIDGGEPLLANTDAQGEAVIAGLKPRQKVRVVVDAVDHQATSKDFVVPAKGGARVGIAFMWRDLPAASFARFSGVSPGLYVARAADRDGKYFSAPFEVVADRGAMTRMMIYPSLVLRFQGGGELDDNKLWFPTSFTIANPSVVPYDTEGKGLLIPLPNGFIGAAVAEEMKARVSVEEHGLLWKGAFPPGQRTFRASFGLEVVDGDVEFEMPLPFGTWGTHLVFEDFPGMTLEVPESAKRESKTLGNKKFILLRPINIRPGRSLVLAVRGLPQPPSWKHWLPLIAGLGVLALLIWGLASVFIYGRLGADEARSKLENAREERLAQLAEMDETLAAGGKPKVLKKLRTKRAALMNELEEIYVELEP